MVKVIKTRLQDVVRQAQQDKQRGGTLVKDPARTGSNAERAARAALATKKRCAVCGQIKDVGDFHRRKKGSDVRSSRCRVCAANAQRVWRRKHGKVADQK